MTAKYLPTSERGRMDQNLRELISSLDGLVNLWRQTESLQWEKSLSRESGEDSGIRSQGGHSDPTGDAAIDPRRVNVRETRVRASREIERWAASMESMKIDLERAVQSWG